MLNKPGILLRREGALLLFASVLAYQQFGWGWWWFFALVLVPDVFMVGYMLNVRVGAVIYNIGHTLIIPLIVGCVAVLVRAELVLPAVFIWTAHIGLDRMLGYGLKYPTYFQDTHLQRL